MVHRCLNIEFPPSSGLIHKKKGPRDPVVRETGWNARKFQLLGLGTPAGVP